MIYNLIFIYFKDETLKEEGLNVVFKKQLKDDDIVAMIKGL